VQEHIGKDALVFAVRLDYDFLRRRQG